MEHSKLTQDQWLDRAAGGIRFPPDRRAVRAELAGHLEDREEALKRAFPDMPREEARERALAGMGDPEALRRELSSVHRPLLGWLWLISRWAALGALGLILASLLQGGALVSQGLGYLEQRQEDLQGRALSAALYGEEQPAWEGERLALCSLQVQQRLGRCTLRVERAALWREEGRNTLYLELSLDYDLPWERSEAPLSCLWAEDDQGNRYGAGEQGYYRIRGQQTGLRRVEVNLAVEDVPRDIRSLTLGYLPGTDLELKLELREEGTL